MNLDKFLAIDLDFSLMSEPLAKHPVFGLVPLVRGMNFCILCLVQLSLRMSSSSKGEKL